MAENLTTGVFTEQLKITADVSELKAKLAEAKNAWDEFRKDLGKDAGSLFQGNALAGLAKSIETTSNTLKDLSNEVLSNNAILTRKLGDLIDGQKKKAIAGDEAKVASAKKAAKEIAKINEATYGPAAGSLGSGGPPKLFQDIDTNIQAAEQKADDDRKARGEAAVNDAITLGRKRAQAALEVQNTVDKIDADGDAKLRRRAVDREDYENKLASLRQRRTEQLANGQITAAKTTQAQLLKLQQERDKIDADSDERRRRAIADLSKVSQGRESTLFKRELLEADSLVKKLDIIKNRLETLRDRQVRLERIQSGATARGDAPGAARAANLLLKVEKEINSALSEQNRTRDKISAHIKTATRENEKLANHVKKVADQAARAEGFFSRLMDGEKWTSTLAHLFRFYILWNSVQGAIWAAGEAVKIPFQLLGMGIDYLAETERAADDMVGVIATNAKFSNDIVENYKIAKTAAVEVTKELEKQAIVTGFQAKQLEGTFKGLMESGATRYVKTLKEMVDLATMFQMSLSAAGAGGLAAQTSVQELSRLFQGNPSVDNKFLKFFGMDPADWVTLRNNTKDARDLVAQLADKSKNFQKALIDAGQGQTVLIENFKLMIKQLAGAGVAGLFEQVNKLLISLSKWVNDNKGEIVKFFAALAAGASSIIDQLKKAFNDPKVLNAFLSTFLYIEHVVERIVGYTAALLTEVDKIRKDGFFGSAFNSGKEAGERQNYINSSRKDLETVLKAKYPLAVYAQTTGGKEATAQLNAYNAELKHTLTLLTTVYDEAHPNITRDFINKIKNGKSISEQIADDLAEADRVTNDFLSGNKSTLNSKFGWTPGAEKSQLDTIGPIRQQYSIDKDKLKDLIDEIKSDLEDNKRDLDGLLKTDKISKTDYAVQLAGMVSSAVADIELLQNVIRANTAKATKQLGSANDLEKRGAAVRQMIDTGIKDEKGFRNELQNINKIAIEAFADAEAEKTAILQAQAEKRHELIKSEYDAQIELTRQTAAAGFTNPLSSFDKETSLKRLAFEEDLQIFAEQRLEAGANTLKLAQIDLKQAVAKAKFDEESVERAGKRLTIIQQEVEAADLHNQAQRVYDVLMKEELANRLAILEPTRNLLEIEREILSTKRQALEAQKLEAAKRLFDAQILSRGQSTKQVRELTELLNKLDVSLAQLGNQDLRIELQGMSGPLRDVRARQVGSKGAGDFVDRLFGVNFKETFDNASKGVGKFGVGLVGAANALVQFKGIIGSIRQAFQEGGILGGVGAGAEAAGGLMTSLKGAKGMGKFGEMLGSLGPYAQAAGAVLSIIGGLFTAAAKRIADSIKRSLDDTMLRFNREQSTLVATIAEVDRLRTDAIVRLSGKKGGKDELDKLLPGIDDQLFNLKKQQTDILDNFNSNLDALRINSDILTEVNQKWQDINKQVKDYLGAGGDAAKAAEYLSLELAKIRLDAVTELNDAEQDAIQSIRTLNDLLEQRNNLIEDFKRKEFDLITADALDRRQAGSVIRGKELADLRAAHDKAISDLDSEINMTQIRVNKEQEVFNLVNDTVALKRRDEELTLIALDAQIQKWKDLQSIVSGITLGPNGYVGSGATGPVTINVQVTAPPTGDPDGWARDVGDSIANAYMSRMRSTPA